MTIDKMKHQRNYKYFVYVVCLGGVLMSTSATSGREPEEIEQKLKIAVLQKLENPEQIAWSAYLASRYKIQEAIPKLEKIITQSSTMPHADLVYLSIFDFLIQNNAPTDPNLILSLVKKYPILRDPGIIILIRQSFSSETGLTTTATQNQKRDTISVLSKIFSTYEDHPKIWSAIANALAENKAKHFAFDLLSRLHIDFIVHVFDSDNRLGTDVNVTTSASDGHIESAEGFPPVVIYSLFKAESAPMGSVIFSPGPYPVAYWRVEHGTRNIGIGESGSKLDLNSYRIKYLETLAQKLDFPQLRSTYDIEIRWTNEKDFVENVNRQLREIQNNYENIKNVLLQKNLLTPTEAKKINLNLSVQMYDDRVDKAKKLPVVHP